MREKKVDTKTSISDTKAICMLFLFYVSCDLLSIGNLLLFGISEYASVRFEHEWVSTLIVAPIVETLIIQLPLVVLLCRLKCHPVLVVAITAVIFALCHLSIDVMYPFYIFYPGLIMTWGFYYFYSKFNKKVAILTTCFIHGAYNFTSLMC
jgi:hypothetical protein